MKHWNAARKSAIAGITLLAGAATSHASIASLATAAGKGIAGDDLMALLLPNIYKSMGKPLEYNKENPFEFAKSAEHVKVYGDGKAKTIAIVKNYYCIGPWNLDLPTHRSQSSPKPIAYRQTVVQAHVVLKTNAQGLLEKASVDLLGPRGFASVLPEVVIDPWHITKLKVGQHEVPIVPGRKRQELPSVADYDDTVFAFSGGGKGVDVQVLGRGHILEGGIAASANSFQTMTWPQIMPIDLDDLDDFWKVGRSSWLPIVQRVVFSASELGQRPNMDRRAPGTGRRRGGGESPANAKIGPGWEENPGGKARSLTTPPILEEWPIYGGHMDFLTSARSAGLKEAGAKSLRELVQKNDPRQLSRFGTAVLGALGVKPDGPLKFDRIPMEGGGSAKEQPIAVETHTTSVPPPPNPPLQPKPKPASRADLWIWVIPPDALFGPKEPIWGKEPSAWNPLDSWDFAGDHRLLVFAVYPPEGDWPPADEPPTCPPINPPVPVLTLNGGLSQKLWPKNMAAYAIGMVDGKASMFGPIILLPPN